MNGIIWLASYPKSGNTWFRVFLTNLLRDGESPARINDLEQTPIASGRKIFDSLTGLESSDLTPDEIDHLRPEVYLLLAGKAEDTLFMKIHDARIEVAPGKPLIPGEATRCAIYLVRNPLDVAVSFAHHNGSDYDTAISLMANHTSALCRRTDRLHDQLRQRLLSWSGHVTSWTTASFPVCLVRYEDMKEKPFETFQRAVRFAGLPHNAEQIEKALRFSAFEVLQEQEQEEGFKERTSPSSLFFRKGRIGSWQEELTGEQILRIVTDHREVMARFGYLDENGEVRIP